MLAHGPQKLIELSSSEVGAGLPAVKAISVLAGKSGATAMLILLFLAVTSAASAEQIAVSSLLTYDVYGTYINRKPTERQILWVSHASIIGYAIFMGAIATAFNYIGISMGYLYELMGTMIGSAVVPIATCICWRKANGTGAVVGTILGFAAGVGGWLGLTAKLNNGVINVETTFGDYEMLTGNLLAIGVGGIISVGWSLIRPANFDWEVTRAINAEAGSKAAVAEAVEEVHSEESSVTEVQLSGSGEKDKEEKLDSSTPGQSDIEEAMVDIGALPDGRSLRRAFKLAAIVATALTAILLFIIPMPQFFAHYIYPKAGFTAWVVIVIMWLFGGLFAVGIYPIFEARHTLGLIAKGIWRDVRRK